MSLMVAAGIGSALAGLISGMRSSSVAQSNNDKNLAFQREQNEIERARADSQAQRTAADAHAAGLSAFDANPVPLGQTAAPQIDSSQVSALQGIGNSFNSLGTSLLDYSMEKSKLETNKSIEDAKLDISDKLAAAEVALKDSQQKINELEQQMKSKDVANADKKNELENDYVAAQTKKTIAEEVKVQSDIAIAANKDRREAAMQDLNKKNLELELELKYEQLEQQKKINPIQLKKLSKEADSYDAQARYLLAKMDIEVDNETLDAMKKIIEIRQNSNKILNSKMGSKWNALNKKYDTHMNVHDVVTK